VAGVVATLLLHALLFTAALWGGGAAKIARLPDAVGAGANSGRADGNSTERMIFVQLSPEVAAMQPETNQAPQLNVQVQKPSLLQVTGPDSMPLPPLEFDDDGVATEASEADLIARTKLAGLYESQIRARIERAWNKTKSDITPEHFCRVKIRQKQDGQVQDVSLESCEGSFEWLDSLTKAIYSASPLPAPPDRSVFVDSFSMQFR
jgi:hypothetical protein